MKRIALWALAALTSAGANASTINFSDWTYNNLNSEAQVDWLVSIDDTSNAGYFTFNIAIGDSDPSGDILGFGFETDIDYGSDYLGLVQNYSTTRFGACANACNFNGTAARNIDYSLAIGSTGTDFITSFSFGMPDFGQTLTTDTFSMVAIRAISIGDKDYTSKDYSRTRSAVAVPKLNGSKAALVPGLLATTLLALFAGRGRRTDQFSH